MFLSPIFGGCKYTNYFLFINKNIVFQYFGLLITFYHSHVFLKFVVAYNFTDYGY